jgi:hypothetical protein
MAGIGASLGYDQHVQRDVLTTYVYSDASSQHHDNMLFFINTAVRASDPVDYYFLLEVRGEAKWLEDRQLPGS